VLDLGPPGDDDYVPPADQFGQQQQPPFVPPADQFAQGQQQPPFVQPNLQQQPPIMQPNLQQQPPYVQNWWLPPWGAFQYPPQQPQPQPRQPEPHKVKLADFWTHQPQVWFSHAEALFGTYHVVEERMKFNLVLPTLSKDTLVRVAAIVTAPHLLAEPYTALRARLLEVYMPDVWEQTSRLLHFRELGDMQPSQLMDEMLAMLPQEEQPGLLFKRIFLDRLPDDVRRHVQGAAREQQCRELAAAADVIWQAKVQKKTTNVAAVLPGQVEEVAEAVAAIQITSNKHDRGSGPRGGQRRGGSARGRGTGRPGGRQGGQKTAYLCYRHARFGDSAWECEDPSRCTAAPTVSGN